MRDVAAEPPGGHGAAPGRRGVGEAGPEASIERAIPHIRSLVPSLAPSDARVARAILADPTAVIELSTSGLARLAEVSPSTVVRCCQRMGFRGFSHLRRMLAREASDQSLHHGDIAEGDTDVVILAKVFASAARVLAEGSRTIDAAAFERAVAAIGAARRVLVVGVGTSAPLAQDAAYRFATLGVVSEAPADVHVQHVAARLLGASDVCIAVSHTGATRETVATVRAAHSAGATTIAVTSFASSPLVELADVVLVTGGPEFSFRHEAMASRLAHLSLLDALYVAVALRSPRSARVALDASAEVIGAHRLAVGRARRGGSRSRAGGRVDR